MSAGVLRLGVAILLTLGLLGCTGTRGALSSRVEARDEVASLAIARWEALIKGDLTAAYGYLSPGTREVTTLNSYVSRLRTGMWRKVKVDAVTCEQEVCKVALVITYDYRDVKSVETRMNEVWVLEKGRWWYVLNSK